MMGEQQQDFQARVVFAHGEIQLCEVFTWELEPHDCKHRSGREWVYDHLTELVDLCDEFEFVTPCWEAVFKGTLIGQFDHDGEWDERLEISHYATMSQPLPEEYFG